MAIDTINKKLALITFLQPWNTPIPISDDGLDQADLQHLLAGYPGILWEAAAAVVFLTAVLSISRTGSALAVSATDSALTIAQTDTVVNIKE